MIEDSVSVRMFSEKLQEYLPNTKCIARPSIYTEYIYDIYICKFYLNQI